MTIPSTWDANAHSYWQKGQRSEAIQIVLKKINVSLPTIPKHLVLQLSYYLALMGDWAAAAQVLKNAYIQYPEDETITLNLGICLQRQGEKQEAIKVLENLITHHSEHPVAWDSLAAAYSLNNQPEKAKHAGEKALLLKDQAAPSSLPLCKRTKGKRHKNILSFTLWGSHPRYLRGALHNCLLAPLLYPHWKCRFYVDDSVPSEFLNALQQVGGELIFDAGDLSTRYRLARRFWVANDNNVDYFLVRDCDSVINQREVCAVQAWEESGKNFHIMRDWWTHTDLILSGLWGGTAGLLPDLKK